MGVIKIGKISFLTVEQKDILLNLTLATKLFEKDCSSLLNKEQQELVNSIYIVLKGLLESILKSMTLELIKRFQKELENITFVLDRKGDPKKSERIINSSDLQDIIGYAMNCCENCGVQNPKACILRNAFKRVNIPVFDPDAKGCKYRLTKE